MALLASERYYFRKNGGEEHHLTIQPEPNAAWARTFALPWPSLPSKS